MRVERGEGLPDGVAGQRTRLAVEGGEPSGDALRVEEVVDGMLGGHDLRLRRRHDRRRREHSATNGHGPYPHSHRHRHVPEVDGADAVDGVLDAAGADAGVLLASAVAFGAASFGPSVFASVLFDSALFDYVTFFSDGVGSLSLPLDGRT